MIVSDILKALGVSTLVAMAIFGVISLFTIASYENKISQLEKQIDHQTILIEILEKSCECE